MSSLRDAFRSRLFENEWKPSAPGDLHQITVVRVPLSENGDFYRFTGGVRAALSRLDLGLSNELTIFEGRNPALRPQRGIPNELVEAVDFALEKELLSREFLRRFSTSSDLDSTLEQLRRESRLSPADWAIASLIASPIISSRVRSILGRGGAITGAFLGLLGGLPGVVVGAGLGYALGAISPLISAALFLGHRHHRRWSFTSEALREAQKLQQRLESITRIADFLPSLSDSRVGVRPGFDDAFPMNQRSWDLFSNGLWRCVLDVLAADVDNSLGGALSERGRAYYWSLFRQIDWNQWPYENYRDIANALRRYEPRERVEIKPSSRRPLFEPMAPADSAASALHEFWTLPRANPQRTNSVKLGRIHPQHSSLILVLAQMPTGDNACVLRCLAYDTGLRTVWSFETPIHNHFDFDYRLRPYGGELIIVQPWGVGQAIRLDVVTGRELGRFPGQPTYVWDDLAISQDGSSNCSLQRYPTGEMLFKWPSSPNNSPRICGGIGSKVVLDYADRFEIVHARQPDSPIVTRKRLQQGGLYGLGEKIKLVNMDAQGIVGAYGAPGQRSEEFSKFLWIGFDGSEKSEPRSFGRTLFPRGGMALLDGKIYLDIGWRGSAGGMTMEQVDLYCLDLETGRDLWSHIGRGDAIPTRELVYLGLVFSGTVYTAVDHQGRTVWQDNNKDKDLRRFYEFPDRFYLQHYAVTTECIVQLFWCHDKLQAVLRTLERFTGRLINMQEIQGSKRDRYWCVHDMVCVDFV